MDEYIEKISQLVEAREKYQRTLGEISSQVVKQYGLAGLQDLSKSITEATGRSIAFQTLRNYKWVWEKTSGYDIPDDISYNTLQKIAASGNIKKYVDLIKEGYTNRDVLALIREDRGETKKIKVAICPQCNHEFEV